MRGPWDASWEALAQPGVCQSYLAVDGTFFAGSQSLQTPDTGSWTQCGSGAGTIDGNGSVAYNRIYLNTGSVPNGPLHLSYYAVDAAHNTTDEGYSVDVDNAPVTVALSAPSDPDDGQPQQIVATATAGPSGVAGIACSVDGAPPRIVAGARAVMSVAGLGSHAVSCYASNHAVDSAGQVATSPLTRVSFAIRQPVVSLISTAQVGGGLGCRQTTEVLRVPARWFTEHYHGHAIRVRVPAQHRRVRVDRCHPRTVVRRVLRDGHLVTIRVLTLPRSAGRADETLSQAHRAVISGWLGEANGVAAAHEQVEILTAAANGTSTLRQVATARTNGAGTWTVRLPAGPSRLVVARFAGTSTLAPATSSVANIHVRAGVQLVVAPLSTHWGSTIRISGQLRGGFIPPSGELVVLWIGWKTGRTEIGHVYTDGSGRFSTRYTFLRGQGSETYRIWAESTRESDYPFAPASSRETTIRVTS